MQHTQDIIYADDITQIITLNRGPLYHNDRIIEQIERVNTFENCWKIQANLTKLKIIHLYRQGHPGIYIDRTLRSTFLESMVLGLKISKSGYKSRITL